MPYHADGQTTLCERVSRENEKRGGKFPWRRLRHLRRGPIGLTAVTNRKAESPDGRVDAVFLVSAYAKPLAPVRSGAASLRGPWIMHAIFTRPNQIRGDLCVRSLWSTGCIGNDSTIRRMTTARAYQCESRIPQKGRSSASIRFSMKNHSLFCHKEKGTFAFESRASNYNTKNTNENGTIYSKFDACIASPMVINVDDRGLRNTTIIGSARIQRYTLYAGKKSTVTMPELTAALARFGESAGGTARLLGWFIRGGLSAGTRGVVPSSLTSGWRVHLDAVRLLVIFTSFFLPFFSPRPLQGIR